MLTRRSFQTYLLAVPLLACIGGNVRAIARAEEKQSSRGTGRATPKAGDEVSDEPASAPSKLRMSKAIACRSIEGYEQYEPLEAVELTSEEKLLVYFRPLGYVITSRDSNHVVHFSQDGRIRRKGEKATVRFKPRLIDIESVTRYRPEMLYLRNLVSLKDLPPGNYEFDIILRDENAVGSTATQTIGFRVVKVKPPRSEPSNPANDRTDSDRTAIEAP